jgi:type II secretory ATPase GspE/PulE/Tfp pilus assembly ATPase PilB-like protein
MLTMHQDALLKAAAGVTSLNEILRVSSGDLLE